MEKNWRTYEVLQYFCNHIDTEMVDFKNVPFPLWVGKEHVCISVLKKQGEKMGKIKTSIVLWLKNALMLSSSQKLVWYIHTSQFSGMGMMTQS